MACSKSLMAVFFLFSAIPLALILALERTKTTAPFFEYHSQGFARECSKWDDQNRRFLVSFMEGGFGQITVPEDHPSEPLVERTLVKDPDYAGNASLGVFIDRPRNRLLVAIADVRGGRYGAVAAYDMTSWERIFLAQLSGPDDDKSLADDVAVDKDGNAYVTDAKGNKIWKVGINGELLSIIEGQAFSPGKGLFSNLIALNGIVYHPYGFLLAIHTSSGYLFRVDTETHEIAKVDVSGGSLVMGDGLELLSSTKLVIAGTPSGRLVESLDGWQTAKVVGRYLGPMHRVASSATLKDGKVYLNHLFGWGLGRMKHVIIEATFSPLNS